MLASWQTIRNRGGIRLRGDASNASYSKSWAVGQGVAIAPLNMYDNSFNGRNDDTVKLGIITDPMTGLMMDIAFKIDCETVHTTTATTKGWVACDLYQAGDDLSGVTRFAVTLTIRNCHD